MKLKQNFHGGKYLDNTYLEQFVLHKILYPVVNFIGLNRQFNLLRHRLGYYNEFSDGRCMWCGNVHHTKMKESQVWEVLEDETCLIVIPKTDIRAHGFVVEGEEEAELASYECPCLPRILSEGGTPIIVHNSFQDMD